MEKEAADKIELKPGTLLAYEMHLASVDSTIEQTRGEEQFLWADASPEKTAQLHNGTTISELY